MNKRLLIFLFASQLAQSGEIPLESGTNVKIEIYRAHEEGHYFAGTHTITSPIDLQLREIATKMQQHCNEDGDLIIILNENHSRAPFRIRKNGQAGRAFHRRIVATHSSCESSHSRTHKMIFCTKKLIHFGNWHAS